MIETETVIPVGRVVALYTPQGYVRFGRVMEATATGACASYSVLVGASHLVRCCGHDLHDLTPAGGRDAACLSRLRGRA